MWVGSQWRPSSVMGRCWVSMLGVFPQLRQPERVYRALRFKKPGGGVLSLPLPFIVLSSIHCLSTVPLEQWRAMEINYHHREQHSTCCICFAKAHTQFNFQSYNGPFNLIIEFNSEEVPMSLQKEMHPHSKAFQYANDVNVIMLARIHLVGIFYNDNNQSRSSVNHFTDTLMRSCENTLCQINRELIGCEFICGLCVRC